MTCAIWCCLVHMVNLSLEQNLSGCMAKKQKSMSIALVKLLWIKLLFYKNY